jgi:hypothetical protein
MRNDFFGYAFRNKYLTTGHLIKEKKFPFKEALSIKKNKK